MRLGARQRTIVWLTGLPTSFILHNVYDAQHLPPRGRPPYSEDFLFRAPLRVQAEAAVFAVKYRLLAAQGVACPQALITAFRHYRSVVREPSFSFDEAFFLASSLDGIWAAATRTLDLAVCRRCRCLHLLPHGAVPAAGCPLCRPHRGAVGSPPPATDVGQPLPPTSADAEAVTIPASLENRIRMLRRARSLQKLGAHPRTVATITRNTPPPDRSSSRQHRAGPTVGRPLNLDRWGIAVKTLRRAQFSLVAAAYTRLVAGGFEPDEAVRAAFVHVSSLFLATEPPSFDRCFEIVSMLDSRWGAGEVSLDLQVCPKCRASFLVSRRDQQPPRCPFCTLIRTPDKFL